MNALKLSVNDARARFEPSMEPVGLRAVCECTLELLAGKYDVEDPDAFAAIDLDVVLGLVPAPVGDENARPQTCSHGSGASSSMPPPPAPVFADASVYSVVQSADQSASQ